ncbi:hypothetical protein XENOCAPTIV_010461, partial [Xenoophorus captivus]
PAQPMIHRFFRSKQQAVLLLPLHGITFSFRSDGTAVLGLHIKRLFARMYEGLTNCTYQLALRMDCFWPNRVVDGFFMQIHRRYFHHCPSTGRLLREPPISILAPFIGVSVLITLLMTAVVVWRSKRTQGMLC